MNLYRSVNGILWERVCESFIFIFFFCRGDQLLLWKQALIDYGQMIHKLRAAGVWSEKQKGQSKYSAVPHKKTKAVGCHFKEIIFHNPRHFSLGCVLLHMEERGGYYSDSQDKPLRSDKIGWRSIMWVVGRKGGGFTLI